MISDFIKLWRDCDKVSTDCRNAVELYESIKYLDYISDLHKKALSEIVESLRDRVKKQAGDYAKLRDWVKKEQPEGFRLMNSYHKDGIVRVGAITNFYLVLNTDGYVFADTEAITND